MLGGTPRRPDCQGYNISLWKQAGVRSGQITIGLRPIYTIEISIQVDTADRSKDIVVVREFLEDGQRMELSLTMPSKPSIKVVRKFKRL